VRRILARAHADVLAQLAWANVLVALDFDGTLAPIVDDRDGAAMRSSTRELLAEVCALYPCAVISGRSRGDVEARLGGVPVRYLVGNHGVEPSVGMERFEEVVRAMRERLESAIGGIQGVEIEDKRFSLALHFRRRARAVGRRARPSTPRCAAAPVDAAGDRRQARDQRAARPRPRQGRSRCSALHEAHLDTALYLGDDVTDEDVFVLDQPGRLISVRVGRTRASSAAWYYIDDQSQIDTLLARLKALRSTESFANAHRAST
jgi:trehalose 6-phosphate phosphatase